MAGAGTYLTLPGEELLNELKELNQEKASAGLQPLFGDPTND
jgi:hypothetical protein